MISFHKYFHSSQSSNVIRGKFFNVIGLTRKGDGKMETRKILVMVMAVVLWLGCGITSADEWWYVDPCGN